MAVSGGVGYAGHVAWYVEVPDVEATLATAEDLGGKRLTGPETVPGGRAVRKAGPGSVTASGGALLREGTRQKERSCGSSSRERPGHWDGTSSLGLVAAGHEVSATTRTPGKAARLREAGAEPGWWTGWIARR